MLNLSVVSRAGHFRAIQFTCSLYVTTTISLVCPHSVIAKCCPWQRGGDSFSSIYFSSLVEHAAADTNPIWKARYHEKNVDRSWVWTRDFSAKRQPSWHLHRLNEPQTNQEMTMSLFFLFCWSPGLFKASLAIFKATLSKSRQRVSSL